MKKIFLFFLLLALPVFAESCLRFTPPQLTVQRSDILQEANVHIESLCENDTIVIFDNATGITIDRNHIYLTKFMNQNERNLTFFINPTKNHVQTNIRYLSTLVSNVSETKVDFYQVTITSFSREQRLTSFITNVAEGKFITAWGLVFSNLNNDIVLPNVAIPKWSIVILFLILVGVINLLRPPDHRMVWWQWTILTPLAITIIGLII